VVDVAPIFGAGVEMRLDDVLISGVGHGRGRC
jgi:hypothetical protein